MVDRCRPTDQGFCALETEVVVNIYKKLDEEYVSTDPYDKTHESTPNTVSALATKIIAAVNIALALNCVDLLHLPTLVHWHSAGSITMCAPKSDECGAQLGDGVKREVGDYRLLDHCVWGEVAGAEICDESEVDSVWLGNDIADTLAVCLSMK
ncbi:hypothetical protein PILCRDRAFT_14738 [Piloderma croceum F 1598]|uniref:Uncharacterized protein n=1 Tax=Piloderma croceum (strain F 1598) TaxID=765440 RepID=A0A0C3F207_PILCF|nr:hypothetical protein PILCRDRAFT_14738 [Piloderma croceum F 1598]